jgi:hypothetical protein
MLLLLPAMVGFLALNVWILVTSLRTGVYGLKGGGQRTPGSTAPQVRFTVSRHDSPGAFWSVAAFNAGFVLVLCYVVYAAAGVTLEALRAEQWDQPGAT